MTYASASSLLLLFPDWEVDGWGCCDCPVGEDVDGWGSVRSASSAVEVDVIIVPDDVETCTVADVADEAALVITDVISICIVEYVVVAGTDGSGEKKNQVLNQMLISQQQMHQNLHKVIKTDDLGIFPITNPQSIILKNK